MPADASEIAGDAAKERTHAVLRKQLTRCCGDEVFQKPAEHHGVSDSDAECGKHRYDADDLADGARVGDVAQGQRFAECAHGAGLHGAAERHLADDAGEAKQHHEEEVGDEKCRAAKLRYAVGEQPDAGQADGRTDARDDKSGA